MSIKLSHQNIVCPYCGLQHAVSFEYGSPHTGRELQFATCDGEDGGCDNKMVVEINLVASVRVFGIDGYE